MSGGKVVADALVALADEMDRHALRLPDYAAKMLKHYSTKLRAALAAPAASVAKKATKQSAPKQLWNQPLSRFERQCWAQGYNTALIDSDDVAKGEVTIDLDRVFLDACNDAVKASTWMPAEYMANDWQADVLDLLRNGPGTFTPQPAEAVDMIELEWLHDHLSSTLSSTQLDRAHAVLDSLAAPAASVDASAIMEVVERYAGKTANATKYIRQDLIKLIDSAGGAKVCTCPSGDGSLRWPCPLHSPASSGQEAVDEYKRRADAYFQTAERQGIRAERLAEALEVLRDRCDDSDGAQYGTLATTFVRDICSAALTYDQKNKP